MPTEEGRRGDKKGDPALTRDDPTRRREEDPVDGPELAWARRPLQHPELMAENEDLEVLGSVDSTSPSSADEETDEGADDEVEEGQHRPIVQGLSERESGFPTPTGLLLVDGAATPAVSDKGLLRRPRGWMLGEVWTRRPSRACRRFASLGMAIRFGPTQARSDDLIWPHRRVR
jgi:hypothetical protein